MGQKSMWFGTRHYSMWVNNPLAGSNMSPQGWGTEGTLLSGGGYAFSSPDSHRQYIFEYSGASSREDAETMQAYRDGVYSNNPNDLIYFHDPLTYSRNILPKRWANPGILNQGNTPLGVVEKREATPYEFRELGVPFVGAEIFSRSFSEFSGLSAPSKGVIWVPVPEGMTLEIKSWASGSSGNNGLFLRSQSVNGTWQSPVGVGSNIVSVSNSKGALLGAVGNFTLYGARAVLRGPRLPAPDEWSGDPRWLVGSGHSGCQFVGSPTWVANSGVNGGQVGYATTLREVGDWR